MTSLVPILVPIFVTAIVVGVALLVCIVTMFCYKARQKEKRCIQLKIELENLGLHGNKAYRGLLLG